MKELNLFYLERLKENIIDTQKKNSDPKELFYHNYKYGFDAHRLLYQFFKKLIEIKKPKSKLLLNYAHFFLPEVLLHNNNFDLIEVGDDLERYSKTKWDLLIKFFPWGLKKNGVQLDNNFIYDSVDLISDSGLGIFYYPHFYKNKIDTLQNMIGEKGCSINSIIKLPKGFGMPITGIDGVIIFVDKKIHNQSYFAEFSEIYPHDDQMHHVSQEIINQNETNIRISKNQNSEINNKKLGEDIEYDLWHGVHRELGEFQSFEVISGLYDIKNVETSYNKYDRVFLDEISIEIKQGVFEKQFIHKENSIYIPALGTQDCRILPFDKEILKSQNIFQVNVIQQKVEPEYLVAFLNSETGKILLDSIKTGTVISKITKSNLTKIRVPLPNINEQVKILETVKKISQAYSEFGLFQKNLLLNPTSKEDIDRLDSIIDALGKLTEADKIKSLIRKWGESQTLEFKETFGWDVAKQEQGEYLQQGCIKTLAGFFNSEGGKLLIGVNDNGEILGIEQEIEKLHKKSNDKFLNHMKNKFKSKLGAGNYDLYSTRIINIDGKDIILIECKKSKEPIFTEDKFYVRESVATDELKGEEIFTYIKNHFNN